MGDRIVPWHEIGRPVEVAALSAAGRSHWVLTAEELAELGFSSMQITARTANGFLHRKHHGVYAVGRPELSFEGKCLAAVRACGPGAGSFALSAAGLWELLRTSIANQVIAPRHRRFSQPGISIHRPRCLPPDALTVHRGVPVTTVARTLLDLAARLSQKQTGWAMHEAAVQRIFDPAAVLMELDRNPHHRGARGLGQLLEDEIAPTRSGLERAGLAICRSLPLPEPETNAIVVTDREEEVDVCWRSLGLIVEWDGRRYHATRWRQRMDAEKTARLEAIGSVVLRFSDLQVELDPAGVAAAILAAATSGRRNSCHA